MSIILVNPPCFWGQGSDRISYFEGIRRQNPHRDQVKHFPAEHLGLHSIQAFCGKRGIEVDIVNGMTAEHQSVEVTFQEITDLAARRGPPVLIGFSGTNMVFGEMRALAGKCRQSWPDARIVVGYDFGSLNAEPLLSRFDELDYVCIGDGELVFALLAEHLLNGRDPIDVPGVARRDGSGQVVMNPPQALDLDELPWPTRGDLKRVLGLRLGGASVYSTRGCPYRCTYCTTGQMSAMLGNRGYRLRDVEDVIDEIEYIQRDFGVSRFCIVDDLFITKAAASQDRAKRFADEILRRKLHIDWLIDARVDSVDADLFAHMQRAGMSMVFIGVETAYEPQLGSYHKRYAIDESPVSRIRKLIDIGIRVVPGVIPFHADVTPTELRSTLDMVDELEWGGTFQLMNRIEAYPGTPLYREYESRGLMQHGAWPTMEWEFVHQQARVMSDRVSAAAMQPHATFASVRTEFEAGLNEWERLCVPQ